MLDLARQRLAASADVRYADLNESLPFGDADFDLVVCPLAIHYVHDRTACLREFFRVLRPGGRVVLSTQHPTTDWLRKGGSYFDVQEEDLRTHRPRRPGRDRRARLRPPPRPRSPARVGLRCLLRARAETHVYLAERDPLEPETPLRDPNRPAPPERATQALQ